MFLLHLFNDEMKFVSVKNVVFLLNDTHTHTHKERELFYEIMIGSIRVPGQDPPL
jgi:hypothetical protein